MTTDREQINRYKHAARVYCALVYEVIGLTSDGDPVHRLTPAGGMASANGAPVDLFVESTDRMLMGPMVTQQAGMAAAFLRKWAAWIDAEGGDPEQPATSIWDAAVKPVLSMSSRGGLVQAWSTFGGAVLVMGSQLGIGAARKTKAATVLDELANGLEALCPTEAKQSHLDAAEPARPLLECWQEGPS